jgi:cobyric acid synthase
VHGMNDVVVVVSGKNIDFKELCGGRYMVKSGWSGIVMAANAFSNASDVVVGNSVLSCTRKNLHRDNYSCRSLFCATPANYGLTNGTTYG